MILGIGSDLIDIRRRRSVAATSTFWHQLSEAQQHGAIEERHLIMPQLPLLAGDSEKTAGSKIDFNARPMIRAVRTDAALAAPCIIGDPKCGAYSARIIGATPEEEFQATLGR